MNSKNSTICILGLGYVGLPLAQAFSKNFKVIGFDTDAQKVNQIASQQSEFLTPDSRLVTVDY